MTTNIISSYVVPRWAQIRVTEILQHLRMHMDDFVSRGRSEHETRARAVVAFCLHRCYGPCGELPLSAPETAAAMMRSNDSTIQGMVIAVDDLLGTPIPFLTEGQHKTVAVLLDTMRHFNYSTDPPEIENSAVSTRPQIPVRDSVRDWIGDAVEALKKANAALDARSELRSTIARVVAQAPRMTGIGTLA